MMTSHDILVMFLSLGTLLACARVMGELARRWNQPSVLGELLAGILLGPTILGQFAPSLTAFLFPAEGNVAVVLDAMATLSVTLFLLVAGMEVDLSTVWKQGRAAISVSLWGMVFPFGLGLLAAWAAPAAVGRSAGADNLVFMLFFATAMAISALPVIAKTLMDINLYRSDTGMMVIAAAVVNDLVGWIVFALILGKMGVGGGHGLSLTMTVVLTLGFTVFTLTALRWSVDRFLPWLQAYTTWPGGILGFALALALFGAAFTDWIGVHAIFGAFLVGVAIGDSRHLREQTRTILHDFISFIFAPLFFASIGLKLDFLAHFDLLLCAVVLVIACIGKVVGCLLGACMGGMAPREGWAIGFAMNARGAMEIILGLLALQHRLIDERLFVALVVMAIVTSMISGPVMLKILRLAKPLRLVDCVPAGAFVNPMRARTSTEAITELAALIGNLGPVSSETIRNAAITREAVMSTGIGHAIAVPHARLPGISAPVVAVGLSPEGLDFNAPDGVAAELVFLIVTPAGDNGAQISLLADIARTFARADLRRGVLASKSLTEFLATLRTQASVEPA